MSRVDRLIDWASAEGSTVGLALFRMVVGLMTIRYLIDYARDWSTEGFYGNSFALPYSAAIPQPTETVYLLLLGIGILSAATLIVGFRTRAAAITCFLIVAYHLSLNQIWYRHNRYFLVLSLFLVALGPSGTALSLDALRSKIPPVGPLWTVFLIKVQMTLIYLASATSKTMDAGWRGGDVLAGRRLGPLWNAVMPDFVNRLLPQDTAVRMLTTQALISEFFLAIFVWFKPTRRLAIWWGIFFHGFIEVQYSVLAFTYLTLGTYFIFADLKCGEKTWVYSSQSRILGIVARLVPFLDWMFQIRLATHEGRGQRFVNRDGTVYLGLMGWIMLGANLPILYPVFYPLSWLRFIRWGRCGESIESKATESARCSPAWMIGIVALYLVFIAAINLYRPFRQPPPMLRFWDLPWFFALMCAMAGAYHRMMVGKRVYQTAPATASAREESVAFGAMPQPS